MANIAYYISDHGYGHASRSIAVIRELLRNFEDIDIYTNCSYPLGFVRDSLIDNDRIKFRNVKNDFGYVSDKNIEIRVKETENRYKNWMKTWASYIEKERNFCESKGIDLIISDICPQPFIVGDELGIPAIGISNFTWYEIYEELFRNNQKLQSLKEAYEKGDLGLIYPFETDSTPFKDEEKIGLVARENRASRAKIRKEMGVGSKEKLVYFGVGKSYFGNENKVKFEDRLRDEISLLVSSGYDIVEDPEYVIPEDETESQDYIGASDLIISKFGYGVVSEGIKSNTPMILAKRNILEDEKGMEKLESYGLGEEITRKDMMEGKYMEKIDEIFDETHYEDLPKRLKRDGRKDIISKIEEFVY